MLSLAILYKNILLSVKTVCLNNENILYLVDLFLEHFLVTTNDYNGLRTSISE